jgi:hypothetical protein
MISWMELPKGQKRLFWEKYLAGELDPANPPTGPIMPEADGPMSSWDAFLNLFEDGGKTVIDD